MVERGNRIKCIKCKTNYYDLGKRDKKCPRCGHSKGSKISNTKFPYQPSSEKDENYYDFIHTSQLRQNGSLSLLEKTYNFPISLFQNGWIIFSSLNIKDGNLKKANDVINFLTPPSDGIKSVLSGYMFPGIGIETAEKLIDRNDEDILQLLNTSPSEIAKRLDINSDVAEIISKGWDNNKEKFLTEIFLRELTFSNTQIKAIQASMHGEIIEILVRRPLELLGRIPRLTFSQIETIYRKLDRELTDEEKAVAAVQEWLTRTENSKGYTCAPFKNAVEDASKLSGLEEEFVRDTINNEKVFFHRSNRNGKDVISTEISNNRDIKVINDLKRLQDNFRKIKYKKIFTERNLSMPEGMKLSNEQLSAVNLSINNPVSVITGGPGSGKSTLIIGIVNALEDLKRKILLCAPTGRAAKRLGEYKELQKHKPITIHMYLALLNTKKPPEFDYVIIDESSMIDINLLRELLDSIPNQSSLILVGDADQLSPIAPGQPFKDIIDSSKFPVSRLTGNYRQKDFSDIVIASREVVRGRCPNINPEIGNSDFSFIECKKEFQLQKILDLYFNQISASTKIETENIQILSPQHRGEIGIATINNSIQRKRGPSGKPIFENKSKDRDIIFYEGDKVIQTSNNYDLGIMNGDIGIIKGKQGKNIIIEFDDREVPYDTRNMFDLDLAYAISIHKSQGSEYSVVIIPVSEDHIHMLSRNLVYTAITRGKVKVVMVGDKNSFQRAIANSAKDFRYTDLVRVIDTRF